MTVLHNYQKQFSLYLLEWMRNHPDRLEEEEDAAEELAPELYLEWLNTPAAWLNGQVPGRFFGGYSAQEALDALSGYIQNNIPVPDPLLDQILFLDCEPQIAQLAFDENNTLALRTQAMRLLAESEAELPPQPLLAIVCAAKAETDLTIAAMQLLEGMPQEIAPQLKACNVHALFGYAKEAVAALLALHKNDDEIFEILQTLYLNEENICYYAQLLGSYGRESAIDVLEKRVWDLELVYADYIAIVNAIEALGGIAPHREYSFTEAADYIWAVENAESESDND